MSPVYTGEVRWGRATRPGSLECLLGLSLYLPSPLLVSKKGCILHAILFTDRAEQPDPPTGAQARL